MRTLALTILTMSIALADGQARAQTYGPIYGPWAYECAPDSYCLQGRIWGYPGNCQFSVPILSGNEAILQQPSRGRCPCRKRHPAGG